MNRLTICIPAAALAAASTLVFATTTSEVPPVAPQPAANMERTSTQDAAQNELLATPSAATAGAVDSAATRQGVSSTGSALQEPADASATAQIAALADWDPGELRALDSEFELLRKLQPLLDMPESDAPWGQRQRAIRAIVAGVANLRK